MKLHKTFAQTGAAAALVLASLLAGCDAGPSDPAAAAQEALANGEPLTAFGLVDQAIEADPNNPAVRILAGDAAMAVGNPDRAITEFQIYRPARFGLSIRWYAANPGFHPIPAGYRFCE